MDANLVYRGDWNTGKRASAVKWKADVVTDVRDRSLFGTPWRLLAAIIDAGWIVPNVVMWKKKVPYPYSGGRRFTIDYEPIIWAVKDAKYYFKQQTEKRVSKGRPVVGGKKYNDGAVRNTNGQSGKPVGNREGRNMRATWELTTAKCKTNHYASMPMEVPRIPIQATSRKDDVVFDPFNGTGTTCCEAKRQGRRWIGIEMNPEFHAYSEKRIQQQKVSGVATTRRIDLEAFIKS